MAAKDIDAMIEAALEELGDQPARPRSPPHARHIIDQYAAMYGDSEPKKAEPSAEVAIPLAPTTKADTGTSTRTSSLAKRVIARFRR